MGLVAFLVLMSVEFALGAVLGRSLLDQLTSYEFPLERSDSPLM
jgi:hypothetical protein